MSYVVVQPPYGAQVAHQSSCWTLKNRTSNDTVDIVPPGAVICSHCHPVPSVFREPEWDEDGFILIRDPRFPKKPAIAHHPLCRSLASRHMGGARWNHRRVAALPDSAKICGLCHCRPPKPRRQRPNGELRPATPTGEYEAVRRPGIGKPVLVPLRCPACSGAALDRFEGGRKWFCFSCDWEGAVVTRTWTEVVRRGPSSTERGEGRSGLRGRIEERALRCTQVG